MDLAAITVVLWQVCLAEAIICLIFLLGILLETGGWRMAVRREVTGGDKGAGALKRFPSLKKFPSLKRFPSLQIFPSLKRFASVVAGYTTRLKKRSQDVLGVIGNIISSPVKPKKEPAGVSERFYSDISEYAVILKSHASAIESLSRVSQELKEEISRQHKILGDLSMVIEQASTKVDSGLEVKMKPEIIRENESPPTMISEQAMPTEDESIAKLEKGIQIPGHFRHRPQPADERDIAPTKEERTKKPCLATRHTLAAREVIAKRGF